MLIRFFWFINLLNDKIYLFNNSINYSVFLIIQI